MELMLFDKTGNCYLKSKRERRKLQKKRNRRKQNGSFMVLHLKAKKLLIVGTATFSSVKIGLSDYDGS